jgi:hypothetical protein
MLDGHRVGLRLIPALTLLGGAGCGIRDLGDSPALIASGKARCPECAGGS